MFGLACFFIWLFHKIRFSEEEEKKLSKIPSISGQPYLFFAMVMEGIHSGYICIKDLMKKKIQEFNERVHLEKKKSIRMNQIRF